MTNTQLKKLWLLYATPRLKVHYGAKPVKIRMRNSTHQGVYFDVIYNKVEIPFAVSLKISQDAFDKSNEDLLAYFKSLFNAVINMCEQKGLRA